MLNPVTKIMGARIWRPYALGLLAAVLICGTWGQGTNSCPNIASTECYYNDTDVAILPDTGYAINKYIIVGGLFDVHQKSSDAYTSCGTELSMEGILNLQAFLWAIKTFGDQQLRNRGVGVGVVAFDSCMRPEKSIEKMLSYAQCKTRLQNLPQTNLVAYVGPYSNEAAKVLEPLATDLQVPLLSPVANYYEKASSEQDRFMIRLRPSFRYTVDAIYSLLKELEVDRVIILYDPEDALWTSAYKQLSLALNQDSKCTHYESAYDTSNKTATIQRLERENIRYLVPLMSRSKLEDLMTTIENNDKIIRDAFRFIISGIGRDRKFMMEKAAKANNSLIIEPAFDGSSNIDYTNFAQALKASGDGQLGSGNVPWINHYYSRNTNPIDVDNLSTEVKIMVANTLSAVKNVIEHMSQAVGGCFDQVCDQYRSSEKKGENLYQLFSDDGTQAKDIGFNVYHYYNSQATLSFSLAAEIKLNQPAQFTWRKSLLDSSVGPYFTEPDCPGLGSCCENPTTTVPTATTTDQTADTTDNSNKNNIVTVFYPNGQEITGAYFDVERYDSEFGTRMDLKQRWIIALGVLAGLGILAVVVFEIYILYMLLGTRMGNKWRTMWLGQLLLFGVLLCYLVLFAYLFIPTKATCGITRFGVGVSYSICFAVLLVKLMVILTSRTSSDVLLPGDGESPNYLKGIYQFLMFIFAVGVQVVIDVQWLITIPPEAVPVISNNGDRVWVCNHYTWEAGKDMDDMGGWVRSNFENHLISLTYIMVLILITTILSLNAHGIITNHRESVFIGIAAGFSIPIWLAWGLVAGLNGDHDYAQEFGDACIAFGLFATATLILFTMFLPKVRQLVNMGVEGIYLEDDRETYYAGSVIMAPPSYKGKGANSVIYVNNQGIYSDPVVIGNGDPSKDAVPNRLRHPGSTYSAPPVFAKKADSTYGGSRVLRVTDDLKGRHPQKPRTQSEAAFGSRPGSRHGTLTRSRSQTSLGAL